ncbi:G-type lectin S-receptor serine/threonine-protein kinase [Salix suchowensis]|nr:G-type lectin S-receptor serine/threonine-protein kinase [Salix suchowensis]
MSMILALTVAGSNVLIFLLKFSAALDSISSSESMSDGKTLVSRDGTFELGFFRPGISDNRYLGIWYKSIQGKTTVWVANRVNPINDSSSLLKIDSTGNLVLLRNNSDIAVWSANTTIKAQSPILRLLDTGNLVLRDKNDAILWQSFDYPCDTMLPGMKLGWDLRSGLNRYLSSWKSLDDPSPGDFTWRVQREGNPDIVGWKGSKKYFRFAPWNGIGFSGAPEIRPNRYFNFNFISNDKELYYTYNLIDKSMITRIVLNQTANHRQRWIWSTENQSWILYAAEPRDDCDNYGRCGPNGKCIISAMPPCQCLEKFKPTSQEAWNTMDWHHGCKRNKELDCHNGDRFIRFDELKLPDATNCWIDKTMNLKECRAKCLQNCSCTAYTNLDITGGGSGCAIWFDDLMDIRQVSAGGQELYVRVGASEIVRVENSRKNDHEIDDGQKEDLELPHFDFTALANATNHFSINNKLGEGGYGPVYRGMLEDGQEIAVKRLSMSSRQGSNEFKNEAILIKKLQHRNLVKLLGCCIQREEKMLIYEYMPNRSLNSFIFDQTKGKLLDWSRRFNIICGTARGLLYLHQDSRCRIVHRDLKASNVLLDNDLNAKISDFGLARMFVADQTEGETSKVIGTYGYMAPEYATDGLFSVKSDVFSFGILLLEIISGKKSRGFYHPDDSQSLIAHTWRLWNEGKTIELIDSLMDGSCNPSEVMRCIHISLLCVQHHPNERPCMASVVCMLGGESELPKPKEPGFLNHRGLNESSFTSSKVGLSSCNEVTASLLEPR